MRRYTNTGQIINKNILYKNLFNNKKINFISQYKTKDLSKLKDIIYSSDFNYIVHTVEPFESLQDISYKYYSSEEYAWVIAYTNQIGCELNVQIDDLLSIYYPLSGILAIIG